MKENKNKKKKRRLRISGLIFILFVVYIIATLGYYLFTMPIKRVVVKGNNIVLEKEIIESAKIDKQSSMFKVHSSKMKKKY